MDTKPDNGQGGDTAPKISSEEWAKVQEQIANLNKGIASVRGENQTYKTELENAKQELEKIKSNSKSSDEVEVDLAPEDQKKLEDWAKKKGFVTTDELEAEKLKIHQESIKSIENLAVADFLEKNKEYDNDEEWAKVQAEFQLYKTPTTLDGYKKLLNKIHKDLKGDISKAKEEGKAEAKAEQITKSRLSLGGGSQGGSDDDQTIESLQKKYKNLSKEQILARKAEIDSLYPKK